MLVILLIDFPFFFLPGNVVKVDVKATGIFILIAASALAKAKASAITKSAFLSLIKS